MCGNNLEMIFTQMNSSNFDQFFWNQIKVCRPKHFVDYPKNLVNQFFLGSRTFVRTDICSNRRKVELMSVRTNVLQLFGNFFKVLI